MDQIVPQDLLNSAMELPATARAELASRLISSLDTTADADAESAWEREIERRLREIDEGHVTMVPWEVVRQELLGQTNDAAAG